MDNEPPVCPEAALVIISRISTRNFLAIAFNSRTLSSVKCAILILPMNSQLLEKPYGFL